MKALRYLGPRRVEIGEMPCPAIGDGEVLVRLHACGVCATDVKTFLRGHPHIPAGSVLGHEMTGVIAESRTEGWSAGARVVVAPYVPCDDCSYCARSQFTLCPNLYASSVQPGGFSEFVRVPPRLAQKGLFRLPSSLDFAVGTLVEPMACALYGLDALALKPGESFLIIGDGPLGLMQAILAREIGATPIVVAGMTAPRLALAARYADYVVNVAEAGLQDAIRDLTHGEGMDKVIVSVGQIEVAENALSLVRRGGRINFFAGLPRGSRLKLDSNRIHYEQVSIVGTSGFAPSHFARALEALTRNAAAFQSLITRTVSMNEIEETLLDSARYEGIKTVVMLGG